MTLQRIRALGSQRPAGASASANTLHSRPVSVRPGFANDL